MKKNFYFLLFMVISLASLHSCSKSNDPTDKTTDDKTIDQVPPKVVQTALADKISGLFSGSGKRMPQGVLLGTYTGCVAPTGWEKNLLSGSSNATITKVSDNMVSITLAGGPFTNNTFTNVTITENASIISFGFGTYNENSKFLSISAMTGSYISTGACLSGLPYYSGSSLLNNGSYTYQTIGHVDFTGTKQ
jgi:hypothetical protein